MSLNENRKITWTLVTGTIGFLLLQGFVMTKIDFRHFQLGDIFGFVPLLFAIIFGTILICHLRTIR